MNRINCFQPHAMGIDKNFVVCGSVSRTSEWTLYSLDGRNHHLSYGSGESVGSSRWLLNCENIYSKQHKAVIEDR